jgi:hypothetical protein
MGTPVDTIIQISNTSNSMVFAHRFHVNAVPPKPSRAEFDPGRIPPAGKDPFSGELKCIEVDSSGAPIDGDHLKGEATIVTTTAPVPSRGAENLHGEGVRAHGDIIVFPGAF